VPRPSRLSSASGTDTIGTLHIPDERKKQWIDLIPVCYAVTYVFGTIGSAWILGNLGPGASRRPL